MVRHITHYINNRNRCRGGSVRVDIKMEVEKFKSQYPNLTPIVVFNYTPSLGILIECEEEFLCGGRQTECTRRAKEMCEKFKQLGVKMVFFLDGSISVDSDKLALWKKRANERYRTHSNLFAAIKNKELDLPFQYTGQILSTYFDNFLRIAREYGEIKISLVNNCHKDIAVYAKKVKALAVFAVDSDFIMMPGNWQIWSPKNLKIEEFTTTGWLKVPLRSKLNLEQQHMPIFATLCGNDYLPYLLLKRFKKKLTGDCLEENLADLVRRSFPKGVPLSEIEFDNLVQIIYDDGKHEYNLSYIKEQVQKSLEFYSDVSYNIPTVEPLWLNEHIEETNYIIVYVILKDIPFTVNQRFIDLSNADFRPYSELVLPLIRRQMGIVLYDRRNEENITRKIYYKPSHEEPFDVHDVTPIYPDKEIPKISDLLGYGSIGNEVTDEQRYEILAWALSSGRKKLQAPVLMELSYSLLLIPSLILNYLVKLNQITINEADVVLLTIFESAKAPDDKMKAIQPPQTFEERPFWIASVFTHLIYYFLNACIVCGLFKILKKGCFDGYVFHRMYAKYLEMSKEEKQTHLKAIQKFRLYAK